MALAGCSKGTSTKSTQATTTFPVPTVTTLAIHNTNDPFCKFLASYNDRFGKVSPNLSDPQQLKATLQDAGAAIKDAANTAPPAVKADVATMSDGFQKFLAILQS